MAIGLRAWGGAIVDVTPFSNFSAAGGKDVVVENASLNGLQVVEGSTVLLSAGSALRITNAGRPLEATSGGVLVQGGSTLNALGGGYLVVQGSQGQGMVVMGNSHATLRGGSAGTNPTPGSEIADSAHNGLVVVNNSSVSVTGGTPLTVIGGSKGSWDMFCDDSSLITGTDFVALLPRIDCPHQSPSTVVIP
jgi:hypothetical protein